VVVRPGPPRSGLVLRHRDPAAILPSTLDRARIDGGVLVIAEREIVVRGIGPILAACAAAGISDANIELAGESEAPGARFDEWRAALAAVAVDLVAEPRTPLRPLDPILVRDGRGEVSLVADDVAGPAATRPRAGEVVLAPGRGFTSLPFGSSWRLSIDLLALVALLGVPLEAVIRIRHGSLELLHAALCRAAARAARTDPAPCLSSDAPLVIEDRAIRWSKRPSLGPGLVQVL